MKNVFSWFDSFKNLSTDIICSILDYKHIIFIAIHEDDIFKVKWITSHNPNLVNFKNELGNTPLHRAAFEMNVEIIELLLAKGADRNTVNNEGAIPLHEAAGTLYRKKFNPKIIELLINKDNINARDNNGYTILHTACASNSKCIKFLLLNGADATIENVNHKIALNASFYFLKSLDIESFKLLYIKSEGEIDEAILSHRLYNTSKLKSIVDISIKLKPLMQIIKNLFVRDGIIDLLQHSEDYMSINLPKFKSLSIEQDNIKYQKFCNYYEMPIKYFQLLLLKEISKAESKELQNLSNIIHNNIIAVQNMKNEQMFNLVFYKNLAGNVITFKQHIYKNSLLDRMCVSNQDEEKDYSIISLKYLATIKILKMLDEKKIDEQAFKSKVHIDLLAEMTDFVEIVYHIGSTPVET